jgi:hypothetical protein
LAGTSAPIVIAPTKQPAKKTFVLMAWPFIVRRKLQIVSRSHGRRNSCGTFDVDITYRGAWP